MIKIGPYIIIKAADYPFFEKAHKLYRCLTDTQVEEILAGKRHTHLNPTRKSKEVTAEGNKKIYPKVGE